MEYTFIRVKRRIDAVPAESLVVNIKKPKVDGPSSTHESSATATGRAGFLKTIGEGDEAELIMHEFLKHAEKSPKKSKAETSQCEDVQPKRIKLIDLDEKYKLPSNDSDNIETSSVTCNDKVMRTAYVYDLYIWKTNPSTDGVVSLLSAFPSDYRDIVNDCDSDNGEVNDDSSDSNSEGNWRNDYPEDDDDLAHYNDQSSYDENEDSSDDQSQNGEDGNEGEEDKNENELQRIKRKYSKILRLMRDESSSLNYGDVFK